MLFADDVVLFPALTCCLHGAWTTNREYKHDLPQAQNHNPTLHNELYVFPSFQVPKGTLAVLISHTRFRLSILATSTSDNPRATLERDRRFELD